MGPFDDRRLAAGGPSSSDPATPVPSACPACRSSSITTAAKTPDADSYWRCGHCGEIWNVARWQDVRPRAHRWR